MTGGACVESGLFHNFCLVAAKAGTRARRIVHRQKIAFFRAIGDIRAVVASRIVRAGDVHLAFRRHFMVTGSASQLLVRQVRKDHMHAWAVGTLNEPRIFNNPARLLMCPRMCGQNRGKGQHGDRHAGKAGFHIQSSTALYR